MARPRRSQSIPRARTRRGGCLQTVGVALVVLIGIGIFASMGDSEENVAESPTSTPTTVLIASPGQRSVDAPIDVATQEVPTIAAPAPTSEPVPTPPPTDTPLPQPTPVVAVPVSPHSVTAMTDARLHNGPGMQYADMGTVRTGQSFTVVAQDQTGAWLQLDNGAWIAGSYVADQVVAAPPAEAVQSPAEAVVAPTTAPVEPTLVRPSAPVAGWSTTVNGYTFTSDCPCDQGNTMNCDDFPSAQDAQACFYKCGGLGSDVHGLDRDEDGNACEWSW